MTTATNATLDYNVSDQWQSGFVGRMSVTFPENAPFRWEKKATRIFAFSFRSETAFREMKRNFVRKSFYSFLVLRASLSSFQEVSSFEAVKGRKETRRQIHNHTGSLNEGLRVLADLKNECSKSFSFCFTLEVFLIAVQRAESDPITIFRIGLN